MPQSLTLKKSLAICVLLAAIAPTAAGKTIYVDADATGANDGSSWADAYNYLQDGLTAALFSSVRPIEIRVAQGIYKPDEGIGITAGDREATFQLINWVTIMGGYAGFGKPDPNARDVDVYETILSGDLVGDDETVPHWNKDDNSYHVVTGSGTNETAVLDGFTIAGGYDDRYETSGRMHFAIGCGGGMYNQAGSPTAIDCTFRGNSSNNKGGGMANEDGSSPKLIGCTFSGNSAGNGDGGGVYNNESSPTITNCIFSENSASGSGGGMRNESSSPSVANCLFRGNSAWDGGGMSSHSGSSPTLVNCIFVGNSAVGDESWGGGMCNYSSTATLANCAFGGNSADTTGGGMCNHLSTTTLANCMFVANSARGGGAVCNCVSEQRLTNCTFVGNSASYGNALAAACEDFTSPSHVWLTNCILWDGGDEISSDHYGSTYSVSYSNVWGGWPGAGNIDADPCFADAGYWDPNGTPDDANDDFCVEGDYHLKSQAGRWDPNNQRWVQDDVTSPCIDAGSPMSPIGHEPFPNGGIVNMGAYGGTAEASKSYFGQPVCETIVAGDINGDCKVNFKDFALAAAHWLEDHREFTYIQWLGHASVKIWNSDTVIYVDPRKLGESLHDATLVLVTHTHGDHYSPADIAKVWGPETKLVAAGDVVAAEGKGQAIMPGQTVESGGVRVTGVAAYNLTKPNHPKSRNWVGFIIEIGVKRIYCAGDTDLTEEMKAVSEIDVAILPVGGTYTMDADEAAEATGYIKPELAIPYHWGDIVGNLSDAQRFAELAHCNVKIMTVGESIRL